MSELELRRRWKKQTKQEKSSNLKGEVDRIGGNPVSAGAGVAKFVIDELDFIENYKVSEFFRKFTAFAMEMTDVTAKGS